MPIFYYLFYLHLFQLNLLSNFIYEFFILLSIKFSNFIIFELSFLPVLYTLSHFFYLYFLIFPLLLLYQSYTFLFYGVVLYMRSLSFPSFLNLLRVYLINLYVTSNSFCLLLARAKKYILSLSKILLNNCLSFWDFSYFLILFHIFFLLLFDSKSLFGYINLFLLLFLNFLQFRFYLLLIVSFIDFIGLLYSFIENL